MFAQFAAGIGLILATALLQAFWCDRILRRCGAWAKRAVTLLPRGGRAVTMTMIVTSLALCQLCAVALWALFYAYVAGSGQDVPFESAFYYSASAYTTAMTGALTMSEEWRVLGTIQSANGLLLLVWCGALLCEVTARFYRVSAGPRS